MGTERRRNEYLGDGPEKPTHAILGDVCRRCGHVYEDGEELHQHQDRRKK